MKFEQSPKRCYMCGKPFSSEVRAIPVVGGNCAPGYVCLTCYARLFVGEGKGERLNDVLEKVR